MHYFEGSRNSPRSIVIPGEWGFQDELANVTGVPPAIKDTGLNTITTT